MVQNENIIVVSFVHQMSIIFASKLHRLKNQRFFIDEFIRLANIGAKTLSASAQSSQVERKAWSLV